MTEEESCWGDCACCSPYLLNNERQKMLNQKTRKTHFINNLVSLFSHVSTSLSPHPTLFSRYCASFLLLRHLEDLSKGQAKFSQHLTCSPPPLSFIPPPLPISVYFFEEKNQPLFFLTFLVFFFFFAPLFFFLLFIFDFQHLF